MGRAVNVVSFELIEKLAHTIRRSLELNEITNTRVVAAAAAEEQGTAEFEYTDEHSTQGMLRDREPSYRLEGASTH